MQIAYTPEQEELKRELRAYFAELMTPEVEAEASAGETGGPACLEAVRTMGRDGWLGIGWPTEYGGQGRGEMEQFIFSDEAWRAGAPIPFLTINTVGKTIMEYGTEAQKQAFLPKILAGQLHFSIGYTEPSAGTDLASLRTAAVKDGDEWRINGQKIYTSLASYADYIWLAARTDPDAPKHKGISIFLVPTTDPGFSYTKIHTMVNASTFNTYYDDVRVGDDAIVYGVNRGWDLIINQLNYERISLAPPGMLSRAYDATVRWAQETKANDGKRVIDQEWVRLSLATVKAKLAYLELIGWKVASSGGANPADASSVKVFGTELSCEAYRLLSEVLGQAATLRKGSPGAVLAGRIERGMQGALILTFGGGVNEVQRDLISLFGLGLPGSHVTERHEERLMDFNLDEEQSAVAELAGKILADLCAPDALRAHEGAGGGVLAAAWSALAQADLLGLALPESAGGGGYGVLEASLVAEQVGRHVAPVPYVATTAAALALAEADSAAHAELLGGVAHGEVVLAIAVDDTAGLVTASSANGASDTLTGEAHFVTWAPVADAFVVAASTESGEAGLYLVRPGEGVAVVVEDAVWGLPQGTLELSAAPATKLGDADAVERAAQVATALNCATVAGLCEGATRITAAYVSEREQFGARIGTFQAVGQRMADSYIDTQGVQLTARQAAWRLAEGLPAAEAVHIAKYWAADGGHRVAHAAQHLHGGIGLDLEYPVHRYFRWIKVLELQLGSGIEHLRRLGAIIATVPA